MRKRPRRRVRVSPVQVLGALTPLATEQAQASELAELPSHAVLAAAAASMSPGDFEQFDSGVGLFVGDSVPWQSDQYEIQQLTSNLYRDPNRREWQVMGKPASGQTNGLSFTHYIYSETDNIWVATTLDDFGAESNNGHLWRHAFDPATGDYYFAIAGESTMWRFVRAAWDGVTPTWVETSAAGGAFNNGASGMGWHPNLFGAGDGGVVMRGRTANMAWRKSTDTWQQVGSSYSDIGDAGGGRGHYFADTDRLIIGTGDVSPRQFKRFDAGSGGTVDGSPTTLATCPVQIAGNSGSGQWGHVVRNPSDQSKLWAIQRLSPYNVYESTDQGVSWNGTPVGTCPYEGEHYTAASAHGVIWFIASGVGVSGDESLLSYLWKPDF